LKHTSLPSRFPFNPQSQCSYRSQSFPNQLRNTRHSRGYSAKPRHNITWRAELKQPRNKGQEYSVPSTKRDLSRTATIITALYQAKDYYVLSNRVSESSSNTQPILVSFPIRPLFPSPHSFRLYPCYSFAFVVLVLTFSAGRITFFTSIRLLDWSCFLFPGRNHCFYSASDFRFL
jgi:hypothetical protein